MRMVTVLTSALMHLTEAIMTNLVDDDANAGGNGVIAKTQIKDDYNEGVKVVNTMHRASSHPARSQQDMCSCMCIGARLTRWMTLLGFPDAVNHVKHGNSGYRCFGSFSWGPQVISCIGIYLRKLCANSQTLSPGAMRVWGCGRALLGFPAAVGCVRHGCFGHQLWYRYFGLILFHLQDIQDWPAVLQMIKEP